MECLGRVVTVAMLLLAGSSMAEGEKGEMRTWTNYRGATMQGALIEVQSSTAIIEKPDGTRLNVPLNRLSRDDQIYARSGKSAVTEAAPKALAKLFGEELTNKAGDVVSTSDLEDKEKIGIYFSAHWCAPCRAFTPKLVKAYEKLKGEGKSFEIVFVSSDRNEKAMQSYMKGAKMSWLAVPFNSKKRAKLKKKFRVKSIPEFVVVNGEGKKLRSSAIKDISSHGATAYDKW